MICKQNKIVMERDIATQNTRVALIGKTDEGEIVHIFNWVWNDNTGIEDHMLHLPNNIMIGVAP